MHDAPHSSPDVAAYVLHNVQLAGPGASPMQGPSYLYANDILPGYIREFVLNDTEMARWSCAALTTAVPVDVGFSVVHYNMVYGHWLLEMMPKLFAIRLLVDKGIKGAIILPLGAPQFVLNFLNLIVPDVAVKWFDPTSQHVAVRTLICPSMYNIHYHYNLAINASLDALVSQVGLADSPAKTDQRSISSKLLSHFVPLSQGARRPRPTRLFISRTGLGPSYRVMANQTEIESIAREKGFMIVHPELMTLSQQIRLYAGADIIAGEFGSGMHNSLFAKSTAKIFCLNWISDVQSRITNLRGQHVGFQLPDDGRPRTFNFEGKTDVFRIDALTFDQHLTNICEDVSVAKYS